MATKIVESRLIPFNIQKGIGVPTHITSAGTLYFDTNANILYQNSNGGDTWYSIFTQYNPQTTGGFSGGTITGPTIFNNGLTATTIYSTTYQNLPTDIRVTGATYSNNTFTFTNSTGGTFSVLFNTLTGLTSTTISATTYQNLPTDVRVTGGIGSGIAIATTTLNGYVTINTGRTVTTSANYGYLTTGGAGTYPGGSQSVVISLYANNRIWGQEIDAFSDERMKNIEGEITLEDGIKLVNNLKPIKYTWKEGDDKGVKAGYSAQQVIKSGFDHLIGLIPTEGLEERVDEDGFVSPKDTQFAMNYDQVTPYHGVVIKHLLEKINDLEKQIKELKNK